MCRLSKLSQYHTQTEFQFTPSTCTFYWIWISLQCPTLFLWLPASPSDSFTQASPRGQISKGLWIWYSCVIWALSEKQNTQNAYSGDLDRAKAVCFASGRGSTCTAGWIRSIPALYIPVLDSLPWHFPCLCWSLENFAFSSDSHSAILPTYGRACMLNSERLSRLLLTQKNHL